MRRVFRLLVMPLVIAVAVSPMAFHPSDASANSHVITLSCEFGGFTVQADFMPKVNMNQMGEFRKTCTDMGSKASRVH